MKNTLKYALFLALAGLASQAHAATIAAGGAHILASQNHPSNLGGEGVPYYISVNSTNAGFGGQFNNITGTNGAGTPFTVAFTQPVQSYRFVYEDTAEEFTTRAGSVGSDTAITMTSTDTSFDSFGQGGARLWTTNDPGSVPNLLTASNQNNTGGIGMRDLGNVSGSVDISGLASGTVWFFYGGYNSSPSITGTMVDTDGIVGDLSVGNAHVGDAANRQEMYAASFDFVNDAGYDSIDYAYTVGTRWAGIVVTGVVPEPSSTALLGLGGLALILRRRR
jgi:hypothetical protein